MYTIEGGLITGPKKGQCAGYIFNFKGHGAYDPAGKVKVGDLELSQEQVDTHNKLLADAEIKHMIEHGIGGFYLSYETPKCTPEKPRWMLENRREWYEKDYRVSNWTGHFESPHVYVRTSFTPGFHCDKRRHIYFTGPDGKQWYGIQQGEHGQNFTGRRLKKQS